MKLEKNKRWLEKYQETYDLYEKCLSSNDLKYQDCYIEVSFYSVYDEGSDEIFVDMDDYGTTYRKLTILEQLATRKQIANGIGLYLKKGNSVIAVGDKLEIPLSDNDIYFDYMTRALTYFLKHQKDIKVENDRIRGDRGNKCSIDFAGKLSDRKYVTDLVSDDESINGNKTLKKAI